MNSYKVIAIKPLLLLPYIYYINFHSDPSDRNMIVSQDHQKYQNVLLSFQAKYPWIMVLSVVTSVMDSPPTGSVHVAFVNVQLLKSIWEIHGVNLVIKDSNLSKTQLMLRSVEGLSTEKGSAVIENSTFGQMKIQSEYKVQMVNCQVDGAMRLEETMLDIKFCDLEIKNCKFSLSKAGHQQPAVLEALGSRVRVQDSSFNWNIGHHGIIEILQGSQLFITNSEFENNGIFLYSLSLIMVRSNSSATLLNCYFANSVAA